MWKYESSFSEAAKCVNLSLRLAAVIADVSSDWRLHPFIRLLCMEMMKEEATSDLSRVIMVCFVHLDLTEVINEPNKSKVELIGWN